MVRDIVLYPAPILKQRCAPVNWQEVSTVCQDLVDTLAACPGVGVAAPQIGEAVRIIAVDVTPKNPGHGLLVLLNPELVWHEGSVTGREGCLSIPEFTANVNRYERIRIQASNPQGESVTIESSGFEAVCLQHELDHLEGILFLDRVASLTDDVFKRKGGRPRYTLEEMAQMLHEKKSSTDESAGGLA